MPSHPSLLMTSSTTVTKNGIRNYNLHDSYEYTSNVSNSLKVGTVIKEITVFLWTYKYVSLINKGRFFLSRHIPKKFGFSYFGIRKLTSPSEGLWLVNPGLLWSFVYLFQALKFTKIRAIQLTDFLRIISWRCLWETRLFYDMSYDKKVEWFGLDRGLLAQTIKRVGMLPVIPIATVSQHQSCNHPQFNMCSPWQLPWQS